MNGPELEQVGPSPLVAAAAGMGAWSLAALAAYALRAALPLPALYACLAWGSGLLAVVAGHRARAAIRSGRARSGGGGLARIGLWLGYPVVLAVLPLIGLVVFFVCCGVVG
ncbi:hypothetical protein [Lysobacter silvisoli]|nr:hypothetical protein [Lysobacter silvisoli]